MFLFSGFRKSSSATSASSAVEAVFALACGRLRFGLRGYGVWVPVTCNL